MQLAVDYENVRAALTWMLSHGDSQRALQLAVALRIFWTTWGHRNDGLAWLRAARAAQGTVPPALRLEALLAEASITIERGGAAAAMTLLEEGLVRIREANDPLLTIRFKGLLGSALLSRGEYALATVLTEERLALARELGAREEIAAALDTLGHAAYEQCAFARARPLLEECRALYRQFGDAEGRAWADNKLALVALYQGASHAAAPLLNESLACFRAFANKIGIGCALYHRAWVALEQGAFASVPPLLAESVRLFQELEDLRNTAYCLESWAALAAAMSAALGDDWVAANAHARRAARLFGAATAMRDAGESPLPPADRMFFEPYLAAARAQLDPTMFAAAWAEGQEMTLEQAIAYALEDAEVS